jgi:hypothetical protein
VKAQYILNVLPFRTRITLKGIKILSTEGNVKVYQGSNCKGRKLDGIKGALNHNGMCLARNAVQFALNASDPTHCSLFDYRRRKF